MKRKSSQLRVTVEGVLSMKLQVGERVAVWTEPGAVPADGDGHERWLVTVHSLTTAGEKLVLYTLEGVRFSFGGSSAGAWPASGIERLNETLAPGDWVEILDCKGERRVGVLRYFDSTLPLSEKFGFRILAFYDAPGNSHTSAAEISLRMDPHPARRHPRSVTKIEPLASTRLTRDQIAALQPGTLLAVSSRTWAGETGRRVSLCGTKFVAVTFVPDALLVEVECNGFLRTARIWDCGPPDEGVTLLSSPPTSTLRTQLVQLLTEREAKQWRKSLSGRAAAQKLFAERLAASEWKLPAEAEFDAVGSDAARSSAKLRLSSLSDDDLAREAVKDQP